jgi:hypothetical protein
MRSSIAGVVLAALCGVALMAGGASAAPNGIDHKVTVGSNDGTQYGPGGDANFSLTALQSAKDGSVKGQWQDEFGPGSADHGEGVHIDVNCLSVAGNDAWVSGIVDRASPGFESWLGKNAVTRVRDNGTSQQDPEDQISFTFLSATVCTAHPNLPLFDISGGQVTVR